MAQILDIPLHPILSYSVPNFSDINGHTTPPYETLIPDNSLNLTLTFFPRKIILSLVLETHRTLQNKFSCALVS